MVESFKKLVVWRKSMNLVAEVYKIVKRLPKEELYALSSQMRRAVVSVPSNIAEGYNRKSTKEYLNYLHFARGSNSEVQTQLMICVRLGFLTENKNCNVAF